MRIMVIGSGAREHAVLEALAESRHHPELYCFGTARNPGIEKLCRAYETGDITRGTLSLALAKTWKTDLVFIGPEAPLATGTADILREHGIAAAAPGKSAARIETSKIFARELVKKLSPCSVPAFYTVRSIDEAQRVLADLGEHYVIKEDGLRGGKGVKVSGDHLHSHEEALCYCQEILAVSEQFIIEQRLTGEEFSLLSFCDGETILHMPPVQDHKRALDGDRGANTGGMGSYTGAWGTLPFLTPKDINGARKLQELVFHGIAAETGEPYRGILYGGYIAEASGVRVIEYNARFGDPEALNLIPLLQCDLADILSAAASGGLKNLEILFSPKASVCKYVVPQGYPEVSVKGIPIQLPQSVPRTHIFLGSVDIHEGILVTGGSRTLACTALADTIHEAESAVQEVVSSIEGPFYHRKDIGTSSLVKKRIDHMDELKAYPLRIGVLGSTRGTSLQPLLDETAKGSVPLEVVCIISDRKDAYILSRGIQQGIPSFTASGKHREQITDSILRAHGVHIVLCVGYMRILSEKFCRDWEGLLYNIHPSLLPDFAGGMDMDVHAAVLNSGVKETGCTIHRVTPEVDGGEIVMQRRTSILPGDTVVTLKRRVQDLEGRSLLELCRDFQKKRIHDRQHQGRSE